VFSKLLIANRGEIACRVMRTAQRLGIRTVAVYSDADRGALHVALADEAYRIGPAPAAESYLKGATILEVAAANGAEAIHPGYGFLSENGAFAQACAEAGIVFVGPPAGAIFAMGSKSEAKRVMEQAGVPLVPGYHGEEQEPSQLLARARAIGFPVLIKASAGGGGKGMRVVPEESGFIESLAAARREALSAFGEDRMLLEKFLERPRHVEIQIFADARGNAVHLFERDCSLQRRYQKVLEEAPAPCLSASVRREMGEAAVAAARAIGYRGAGTVEFLLDQDGSFYFMEMNTRLQVEHAVTELITGQDLVEWQLRVAAGEPLPLAQHQLSVSGHAFEARLYAEDPARDFLPCAGRLVHFRLPGPDAHLRVDTGVREGDEIGIHYDPLIAKLVVWDLDRPSALRRLGKALFECRIAGVASNVGFLAKLAAHEAFAAGLIDTGFLERYRRDLIPEPGPASDHVLALATLELLLRRGRDREHLAATSADPFSLWDLDNAWRLNLEGQEQVHFLDGEVPVSVKIRHLPGGYLLDLPGGAIMASVGQSVRGTGTCGAGPLDSGRYLLDLKGEALRAGAEQAAAGELVADLAGQKVKGVVVQQGDLLTVFAGGRSHTLRVRADAAGTEEQERGDQRLTAPMPGKVIAVLVQPGERVERGRPLMILEAMKMEQTVTAPRSGTVGALNFGPGAQVREGAELLTLVEEEG
jgi:3-methylcrotonyl-CoA carboxylase alpha subunit